MIEIKEENFEKAYNEGCFDVKKVLQTLVPDFQFKKPFPKLMKYCGQNLYFALDETHAYCILSKDRTPLGCLISPSESTYFEDIKGIEEIK
jgi:hypothetical protein